MSLPFCGPPTFVEGIGPPFSFLISVKWRNKGIHLHQLGALAGKSKGCGTAKGIPDNSGLASCFFLSSFVLVLQSAEWRQLELARLGGKELMKFTSGSSSWLLDGPNVR